MNQNSPAVNSSGLFSLGHIEWINSLVGCRMTDRLVRTNLADICCNELAMVSEPWL
jgi:hypothetical protein